VPLNGNGWNPTRIVRFVRSFATSTGPVRVDTDSGEGYLKALGNPEGPHALACELVGNMLADWLGLSTFDYSLIEVTEDDEIPFANGQRAAPGPGFISRAEEGFNWGGDTKQLRSIINPREITGLVLLDTWVLNSDRYSPDGTRVNRDNVFFIKSHQEGSGDRLVSMDFTHAFRNGQDINRRLGFVGRIQDTKIYGRFPEFRDLLSRDEARRLSGLLEGFDVPAAEAIVGNIPPAWEVDNDGRSALVTLIVRRARFVAEHFESELWPEQPGLEGGTV
jgi:hypothetical protein